MEEVEAMADAAMSTEGSALLRANNKLQKRVNLDMYLTMTLPGTVL